MGVPLPALRRAERTRRVPADDVDRLDLVPAAAAAEGCMPMISWSMLKSRDLLLSSTET